MKNKPIEKLQQRKKKLEEEIKKSTQAIEKHEKTIEENKAELQRIESQLVIELLIEHNLNVEDLIGLLGESSQKTDIN